MVQLLTVQLLMVLLLTVQHQVTVLPQCLSKAGLAAAVLATSSVSAPNAEIDAPSTTSGPVPPAALSQL